jgi:predicted kinase
VVLMCGIAGAGKTTYATQLEARGYVRLSIDEELWQRHGRHGFDYNAERRESLSAEIERELARRLVDLINQSRDVVVDFSFWRRTDRDRYRQLISSAGGRWELVYLRADEATLRRRLATRNARRDANAAFPITDALLAHYIRSFEVPVGEGETVIDCGAEW